MRKILFILGLVFLMLMVSVNADLNDSITHYWKFDDGTGTSATDSVGSLNWALSNSALWSANSAKLGTHGLNFSVGNYYATTGTRSSFNFIHEGTSNWTWNVWIYWVDETVNGRVLCNSIGADRRGISWSIVNRSIYYTIAKQGSGWPILGGKFINVIPESVGWHMITLTMDKDAANEQLYLYVNGEYVDNANKSSTFEVGDAYNPMHLGRYSSGGLAYLSIPIDELVLWKRVLTPSEITQIYNSGDGDQYPFSIPIEITSVEYQDILGSTTFYEDESMDYFKVNISEGAANQSTKVLLYLTDGNDNIVLNNVSLTNTSLTEYNYSNNVLLNNVGTWNYTIYLNTDESNVSESGSFTVNEVELSLATSLYGWDYEGVPSNNTLVTDAATYYFDYQEITFDVTTNWKTILERINATKSVNKKVILTMYDNLNGSNHTVEYIHDHFSDLVTPPYLNWVYAIFIKVP